MRAYLPRERDAKESSGDAAIEDDGAADGKRFEYVVRIPARRRTRATASSAARDTVAAHDMWRHTMRSRSERPAAAAAEAHLSAIETAMPPTAESKTVSHAQRLRPTASEPFTMAGASYTTCHIRDEGSHVVHSF